MRTIYLFAIAFLIFPIHGFQLDDLLKGSLADVKRDRIGKGFIQCSYPDELISYDKRHKILEQPVVEVILRFVPDKTFRAADIIIAYAVKPEQSEKIRDTGEKFAKTMETFLSRQPDESDFVFQNKATVHTWKWVQKDRRIYLFSRIADSHSKRFSFIFLRIEPTNIPEKDFIQKLRLKRIPQYRKIRPDGGKLINVPMRTQLRGTGGCWFTSTARQLNYFGSDINSLLVSVIRDHSQWKKLEELLNFKRKIIQINNRPTVEKSCLQFINDYNEAAKKRNQPVIRLLKNGKRWNDNMNRIKPEILKEMKMEFINQKKYHLFRTTVRKYLDDNIPVGWFVVRCIGGAHQRLIIGYNPFKDTLYYSDSWSPKSEVKEMPTVCVYLMTRLLEIYTPNRILEL